MHSLRIISNSPEETQRIAEQFAKRLKAGDCLALIGDFGSGKTTFVRGLARGLGFRKKNYVCSPSFVILKIYKARLPIYHFDVYRLNSEEAFEGAGIEEFVVTDNGVSVIEWAQKVEKLLPKDYLKVEFSILGANKRGIKFLTSVIQYRRLLRKIKL